MGATSLDMQNRCLHFDVVALSQCASKTSDGGVSHLKDPTSLVIDDQIGVTLSISGINVGQAMKLVGQRAQGLCEKLHRGCFDREFTFSCRHHCTASTDPVA